MRFSRLTPAIALLASLLLLSSLPSLRAQGGSVDPVFGDSSLGLYHNVLAMALQPDGKILATGARHSLVRLNADGTRDTTFQIAIADGPIATVVLQPDGRILFGGTFTQVNGVTHVNIVRLNADGSLDTGFIAAPGIDGSVNTIALDFVGRILLGGTFTQVNRVPRAQLARLEANGELDYRFTTPSGTEVRTLVVQSDGQILVGRFSGTVNGVAVSPLIRLLYDGSPTSFNVTSVKTGHTDRIAVQENGDILFAGSFPGYGEDYSVLRVNSSGVLDTGFTAKFSDAVNAIVPVSGNKILVGGDFTLTGGTPSGKHDRIVRLSGVNGNIDAGFGATTDDSVATVIELPDHRIYVGGRFGKVNGRTSNSLARLSADGTIDGSFQADVASGPNSTVRTLALQADRKVLLGGEFSQVQGVDRSALARLNADASLDTGFTASADGYPDYLLVQPDGRIVLCGVFSNVNGVARYGMARLNADGTLDVGFSPNINEHLAANARTLALQADGKILVGGEFEQVNGIPHSGLARLNADGTLDASFTAGVAGGPFGIFTVHCLVVQDDGKVLVGGRFTRVNGATQNYLARLNANGSLDTSFTAGTDSEVFTIAVRADGKLLVGGTFKLVNGVSSPRLALLNPDGSLDEGFIPDASLNVTGSFVNAALRPDGTILVTSLSTLTDGSIHSNATYLNADGSRDLFYPVESGADGTVYSFVLQTDGKVLLGGDFSTVNGMIRNNIARLNKGGAEFFGGQVSVGGGFYYMDLPDGTPFGYYNLSGDGYTFPYFFHNDLGLEYYFDAQDEFGGMYLYDFASGSFFYTSRAFAWPYVYDFSLRSVLYYYPDADQPGHYTTHPRYFYNYATRSIITK